MSKKYQFNIRIPSGSLALYSEVPELSEARCKWCGKVIYWLSTSLGRIMPVSRYSNELVSHFAMCDGAEKFRRKKILKKQKKYDNIKRANLE